MKKIVPILITIFILAGAAVSYKILKKSPPDYIFLVTLDTTRADFVRYSLLDNKLTPNLAGLAKEGIYYENAYSLIPITLPSHASMFYSLPPHVLKVYNNGQPRPTPFPSLAQLLKGKGYQTGAVVSLGVVKAEFGLDKGFEHYVENFRPYFWYKTAAEVNRDAFELVKTMTGKKAFFWIHYSDPHEPYYPPNFGGDFSLFLNDCRVFQCKSSEQPLVDLELELKPGKNFLDLKSKIPTEVFKSPKTRIGFFTYQNFSIESEKNPGDLEVILPKWRKTRIKDKKNYYARPNESRVVLINRSKENIQVRVKFLYRMLERPESRKSLYRKEIRYMDNQVGKFFEFLKKNGIYEKSVFFIMGDHGEGLGEYQQHYGHIHYLNKIYSKVPLIIFGKGIKDTGKRDELASNLNIAPTILDIVNIEKPGFMRGESLLKSHKPRKLLLETYSPEAYFDAFSIIDFPYQILFYPGRSENKIEYIDLQKDIWGINNIKDQMKDNRKKSELLNDILKISRILTATKGKIGKISERHKDILNSLGYL